jgi:hypothetical protein
MLTATKTCRADGLSHLAYRSNFRGAMQAANDDNETTGMTTLWSTSLWETEQQRDEDGPDNNVEHGPGEMTRNGMFFCFYFYPARYT